jgi:hypothetical protein
VIVGRDASGGIALASGRGSLWKNWVDRIDG